MGDKLKKIGIIFEKCNMVGNSALTTANRIFTINRDSAF